MPRQGLDRARVVAEAAALADEEGLEAVTLAALAARLGVRAPSLYKHVDGLGALRVELATRTAREVADVLAAAVAGRSGADAVRAAGVGYVAYARAHPGRYALAVRAARPEDVEHRAEADRAIEALRAALRGLGLEGDEATHAVRILRSTLHGFCALEAGGGFALALDRDATLERLLDVVVAGLAAAG